jgi:serine/threonine protein kinase
MGERQGAVSRSSGPDPLIGRVIDERFRIVSVIARGGMGKVYRAEQSPLGRVCALKILNPNYSGENDPEFHKRFFLEASIASKLTHPNTVTIFDYGRTADDIYYMAMEYLEGVTLHRAIREAGCFREDRACHIARQICRALREAHSHGVIHRDLKPANIFLTEHGDEPDFVKVLDFGLVKNITGETKPEDQLTQTGLFMGSPKYMAPEQIRGENVDGRTDVYSLGIILYEMLAGKVPFERNTSLNILMAQVNDQAPPLRETNPNATASALMEELVAKCLAKDPNQRFSSMNDVLIGLKRLGGLAVQATGEFSTIAPPSGTSLEDGLASVSKILASPGSASALLQNTRNSQSPSRTPSPMSGDLPPPFPGGRPESGAGHAQALRSDGAPDPDTASDSAAVDFRGGARRRVRTLGIVVAALGAGAIGFFALRSPTSGSQASDPPRWPVAVQPLPPPAPVQPVATTSITNPVTGPLTSASPPAPTSANVRISSDPSGATVKEDGREICAATPCDHEFELDQAKEHRLTFAKAGYRPEVRTVRVADSPVSVRLARSYGTWSPAPAPKPPTPPADNTPTPSGFKEIPY